MSLRKKSQGDSSMDFPVHVAGFIPKDVPDFVDEGDYLESIMVALEEGHNVLIIGPTGTGKTHIIRKIGEELELPVLEVSFTLGTDVTDIIGRYELKEEETKWIYGPLPLAMKYGTLFYADEINMARPDIVSRLHPCLDDRRALTISEHEEELIKAHDRYRFIAAMNPVELGYAGTRPLSPALKRRFEQIIYITYPKKETELKIIKTRSRLKDESILERMIEVANQARRAHEEGIIATPATPANLIAWAQLIARDIPVIDASERTMIHQTCDSLDSREYLRGIIKTICKDL
ncbi:MAG: MoxR family ATPase [Candidatus Lokiarchaeota archaeon]|nr:MoxR family ATPase [Candidatus Lokiarchaeota archaeon]